MVSASRVPSFLTTTAASHTRWPHWISCWDDTSRRKYDGEEDQYVLAHGVRTRTHAILGAGCRSRSARIVRYGLHTSGRVLPERRSDGRSAHIVHNQCKLLEPRPGSILGVKSVRTWEWDPNFPVRSILPPLITTGIPFLALRNFASS